MKQSGSSRSQRKTEINEDYILQQCNDLLNDADVTTAPVNLALVASLAGIKRIEREDIEESGMLCPLPDGDCVVLLRKSDSPQRQNFTCAHEISHTFFPDYRAKPQKRIDPDVGKYDTHNKCEYLCDFGASNLLMPDFLFKPEFKKKGFCIESLTDLSKLFDASLEAVAIRMAAQNPSQYGVVVWEEAHKPKEYRFQNQMSIPSFDDLRPKKKLRVRFASGFARLTALKHKSLEESEGVITQAFTENKSTQGYETVVFGSAKAEEYAVMAYPTPKYGRVISLIRKK